MFENRQQEVEQLMSENIEFRRLFNKHQKLHDKVSDAEHGVTAVDDLSLVQMKKEKLWAKDRLTRMLDSAH